MSLQGNCRECGKLIAFLKLQKPDGTVGKNNPVETEPHAKGNLVISLEKGLYRFATQAEIEQARTEKKNLYISHFSNCEFAENFRKK